MESYNHPDIIEDEFQATQGQIAWVASRGQDTSDHLAFVEHKLKSLWVQVRLEQKYLRHLIKEHVLPLQSYKFSDACQCPILGGFRASPIPTLFRDLHSEVCQEHGIFQTFSLLFFTTFCFVLSLHTLFSQFHSSRKDKRRVLLIMT